MMNSNQPPICDYEGSDYQTTFWDEGERAYEDQVEAIAIRRLLPESGEFLLEIGAGAGRNTPRYKGYKRIVLLDYSKSQLQQAKIHLGTSDRYIFVAANAYQLPFVPGVFDGATMIRTLHHMAEPKLALDQVRLALQPGATFILEYANKRNLKAILRYAFRQQSWNPFTLEAVEFATLNFDFHPKSVRSWLKDSGFSIDRQLTVSHFRIGLLKQLFPLDLLIQLDSIAQLSGNLWQLSPSVFVSSTAIGNTTIATPGALFRCLVCDHDKLEQTDDFLICPNCHQHWGYENGIYDFRLN